MNNVFLTDYNAVCSLGLDSENIFNALVNNRSGVDFYPVYLNEEFNLPLGKIKHHPFVVNNNVLDFNSLCLHYIKEICIKNNIDLSNKDNQLILATTKGNVNGLYTNAKDTSLNHSILYLEKELKAANKPFIISNACISGMAALILAHDLVLTDKCKNVIVCAADVLSPFVISGFNILQAMDYQVCKPYDKNRQGVNLGEACAVALVSKKESEILLKGGAISNDANHISGPSRDGSGLAMAVSKVIKHEEPLEIDLINAHGTGTLFNDEMECKAFYSLNLQNTPLNSLKAYFGHTLGAAGLLESIACAYMIKNSTAIKSLNFNENGLSKELNIITSNQQTPINTVLKTASGFGGCNAALILKKHE